jgi:hypothetical protein
VELDVKCRSCDGDNYGRHKFCGWCGVELGAPTVATDEVTDHAALGVPGLGGDSTSPGQVAADPTTPGVEPAEEATVLRPAVQPADGVLVSMLGEVGGDRRSRSRPVLYRLELGEPFDVDDPSLEAPGTFTATIDGLRLDSLGSLEGVYRQVRRDEKPVPYRRLRVSRELGTFQALAPGETIPLGCLAILDRVLVRVEPG